MERLLLAVAVIIAWAMDVRAETLDRTYQAVMHVRESQAIPVLGESRHSVGVARFRGIAVFADGELAVHRYEGWFDLVDGSGRFSGYAQWRFEDGATLRAAYDGTAEADGSGNIAVAARLHSLSGTGRFAGATGTGGFSGRRLDPIAAGGGTYLTGALSLTRPTE